MLHRRLGGESLGFSSLRSIGANFLLCAAFATAIGSFMATERLIFDSRSRTTTAEVLVLEESDGSGSGIVFKIGDRVYAVELKWTDHEGVEHIDVPRVRSSEYNFEPGNVIDIDYVLGSPNDVRPHTQGGPWMWIVLFFASGLLMLLLGGFLRFVGLRLNPD